MSYKHAENNFPSCVYNECAGSACVEGTLSETWLVLKTWCLLRGLCLYMVRF